MTNFAKDLFDDLKESRLWPLAIALVVALVAIPVVLSKPAKEPGGPVAATAAPAAGGAAGASLLPELQPIANVDTATQDSERKSVDRLNRKNPFEPLVKEKSASSSSGSAPAGGTGLSGTPAALTGGDSGMPGAGTTTGTTGGGSTTSPSTGSDTATQAYYTYVAKVKFGELGQTENKTLQRMRAMPSTDNPIVIFLGATTDAETAVFLVSTSADPSGDGKCKPSDDQCTFLYLKAGETQTFDVADDTGALKTYELTLRKIEAKTIEDPTSSSGANSSARGGAKARAATGRTAKAAVTARKRAARQKAERYFQAIDRIGF